MKDESRNLGANADVILLAEDSEADVFLLRRSFEEAHIPVSLHVVKDGVEAMAYLQGDGKYANREEYPIPDLLLIDLKMPRLNGFDVLALIRGQPGFSDLQVVMLTSSDYRRDAQMADALGVTSFVIKPVDPEGSVALTKSIHDLCVSIRKKRQTSKRSEQRTSPNPSRKGKKWSKRPT